jgi:hypothetical protein
MNLAAFLAMLARDGRVARRNFLPLLLQNLVQPMLFVFVFGRVMTTSGMMPQEYKSLLLPGIIAISMLLSGLQAVAFPMIADFQFSREIEDRLLAPMEIEWVAIEKEASRPWSPASSSSRWRGSSSAAACRSVSHSRSNSSPLRYSWLCSPRPSA